VSPLRSRSASDDVRAERLRAHYKHSGSTTGGKSAEEMPHDDPLWLPVLTEELGEVARELCDHRYSRPHALRAELVQLAAMAQAWADAIEDERGA
jgi:hypothetical protein